MKNVWLEKYRSEWTAVYAPKGWHKSGFTTEKEAKKFARTQKSLDSAAWFFLPTYLYKQVTTFEEMLWSAGYYPAPNPIHSKQKRFSEDDPRWVEYLEFCERVGIEPAIPKE